MDRFRAYVYDLPALIAARLEWLPPLLARVIVGWVFATTGWGKLQNLPKIVDFFRDLGIPYPELQAPFVSTVELACGTLLIVGLFTRFAAVPLIGTMIVAIATAQWQSVDSAAALFGLVETAYVVVLVWLAIEGPGPVSLDRLIERSLSRGAGDPDA
ncbi:MAG: putative oxidoreductase [Candidatus Binatota bacterium]|nr:putative oxidoreductase [Candidatus Binatota bacterium]